MKRSIFDDQSVLVISLLLFLFLTITGCFNNVPKLVSQSESSSRVRRTTTRIFLETATSTPRKPELEVDSTNENLPTIVSTPVEMPTSLESFPSPTNFPNQALQSISTPINLPTLTLTYQPTLEPPALSASVPKKINIPALAIDAGIETVGLTKNNAMDVPKDWHKVGWYELGFAPGQFGNMVMTGHVDSPINDSGIFKNLNQLEIGDRIYLEAEDGTRYGYIVESYHYYPYDEAPLEEIFGFSSEPRLNLITCRGNWNKGEGTYDQRLVVYARQTHSIEVGTVESEDPPKILPEEN